MCVRSNIFLLTSFLALLALPVQADQCAQREHMTGYLGDKFAEAQTGAGLQTSTQMVEVWASSGGSWTILVTRADGVSCIVASGTHWRETIPAEAVAGIPG